MSAITPNLKYPLHSRRSLKIFCCFSALLALLCLTAKSKENKPSNENSPEKILYEQARNDFSAKRWSLAAGTLDEFIQKFPQSGLLDQVLFDRSACHFNLEEYKKCISGIEQLQQKRGDSRLIDRARLMAGDAYDVLASLETESAEKKNKLTRKALEYFDTAVEAGKEFQNNRAVAEALARAADLSIRLERWQEAANYYDRFFPDYAGIMPWEAQISAFTMEALEKLGRGEDGLRQLEKMINSIGEWEDAEQNIDLLRQAIGSYSEASVRINGAEKTAIAFDNFPRPNQENLALLTWLKIQQIIVLQGMRSSVKTDSTEYQVAKEKIAYVFEEIAAYEIKKLPGFALMQIGLYLSKTDEPPRALHYFKEVLIRDEISPKAHAELESGKIEMQNEDELVLNCARERFLRLIHQYDEKQFIPEAYMNLGRLAVKQELWEKGREHFSKINKNRVWLDRQSRAESNFLYGFCLEKLGKTDDAIKVYNATIAVYGSYIDWSSQALERGFALAYKIDNHEKKVKAYSYLRKILYMFQRAKRCPSGALSRVRRRLPEVIVELGLTPEQVTKIDVNLGIVRE